MLGTVPDGMSFDEASTMGVGSLTAALGLWKHLGLKSEPGSAPSGEAVLVYGASSSVGYYAVQLAAIAGYRVVAVASKRNHGLVTENGAAQAVDYNDPDWVDQIARESQNKKFVGAFDAIGGQSLVKCFEAMSKAGAPKARAATTIPTKELLGAALQEKLNDICCINLGTAHFDAQRPYLVSYVQKMSALLADGQLKPSRVKVLGGLGAAIQGYQDMQTGKVSGEKLVVHPSE
jgi:NADPH:quinone reductase-like Zn-dependent oxidoreductase